MKVRGFCYNKDTDIYTKTNSGYKIQNTNLPKLQVCPVAPISLLYELQISLGLIARDMYGIH